jgi:hypothetical protein
MHPVLGHQYAKVHAEAQPHAMLWTSVQGCRGICFLSQLAPIEILGAREARPVMRGGRHVSADIYYREALEIPATGYEGPPTSGPPPLPVRYQIPRPCAKPPLPVPLPHSPRQVADFAALATVHPGKISPRSSAAMVSLRLTLRSNSSTYPEPVHMCTEPSLGHSVWAIH